MESISLSMFQWEGVVGELKDVLPSIPKREQLESSVVGFEYYVSRLHVSDGEGSCRVFMRMLDLKREIVPVSEPSKVIEELCKYTGKQFQRLRSSWKSASQGSMGIEIGTQVFQCIHIGCNARIRAVCWKPKDTSKEKHKPKSNNRCSCCAETGHNSQRCCLKIGICSLDIYWVHTHTKPLSRPVGIASLKRKLSEIHDETNEQASKIRRTSAESISNSGRNSF